MNTFDQLLEKHYPKKASYLQLLMEMVEKEMDNFEPDKRKIIEEAIQTLTMAHIPDIPISEIGWSSVNTPEEGTEIPSAQRTQLMNFLQHIQGENLQQKVKSVSEVYSSKNLEILTGTSVGETIAKAMSYLVFFKTLTAVITNFNASAAGFTFESFLGVLLGGKQVPTSSGTIADLITGDGIPISLKLYAEKSAHVGGSYTDLIKDLVRSPYLMQYVVVMKNLTGSELDLEGDLGFYQFNFTLENVFEILAGGRGDTPLVIQLPEAFVSNQEGFDIEIPNYISGEEARKIFEDLIEDNIEDKAVSKEIIDIVNWIDNKDIFGAPKKPGFAKISVGSGGRAHNPKGYLVVLLKQLAEQGVIGEEEILKYHTIIYNANEAVRAMFIDTKEQRSTTINDLIRGKFASTEKSREFYSNLSNEDRIKALRVSRGYLYTDQFEIGRNDVYNIEQRAGQFSAFATGQSEVKIGTITIGTAAIESMLATVSSIIDDSIFEIFNNLKVLTTNIQGYFAGGLSDDTQATTAITAAENIEKKTEDIRPGK